MGDLIYSEWVASLKSAGIKPISDSTCCQILAILYVYGNNEEFTSNDKFLIDLKYAQERFKIVGGLTPDPLLLPSLQKEIKKLQDYEQKNRYSGEAIFGSCAPSWATELMKNRYNIKLR